METTAVYDKKTDEIVVNTPTTLGKIEFTFHLFSIWIVVLGSHQISTNGFKA